MTNNQGGWDCVPLDLKPDFVAIGLIDKFQVQKEP